MRVFKVVGLSLLLLAGSVFADGAKSFSFPINLVADELDIIKLDMYLGQLDGGVCQVSAAKLIYSHQERGKMLVDYQLTLSVSDLNSKIPSYMYTGSDCVKVIISNITKNECYFAGVGLDIESNKVQGVLVDGFYEGFC